MSSFRRMFLIGLTVCLMATFAPVFSGSFSHAEPVPKVLKPMIFDGDQPIQYWRVNYQWDEDGYGLFFDVPGSYGSSDENVAKVDPDSLDMYSASIVPCGVGECTIWFGSGASRPDSTTIAEVKVTVTEKGLKSFIKQFHFPLGTTGLYGSTEFELEGLPNAAYKITIGDDDYTGEFSDTGTTSFSLNSIYKLNTKINYEITSGGVTAVWTDKIKSGTEIMGISRLKGDKTIKVYLDNPHTGDVLKVTYAGKTYTKKITKDYDGKEMNVRVKLKHKVKDSKSMSVSLKNKYKQTLDKCKTKVSREGYWKYD